MTGIRAPLAIVLATTCVASGRGQDHQVGDEWEYAPQERYLQVDLRFVETVYLQSLSYLVEGVVENALREVARIKLARVAWESAALREKLDGLSREGITPAIRYKASLVKSLFETPALFAVESGTDFRTPGQLYHALARRLEASLIAGG